MSQTVFVSPWGAHSKAMATSQGNMQRKAQAFSGRGGVEKEYFASIGRAKPGPVRGMVRGRIFWKRKRGETFTSNPLVSYGRDERI